MEVQVQLLDLAIMNQLLGKTNIASVHDFALFNNGHSVPIHLLKKPEIFDNIYGFCQKFQIKTEHVTKFGKTKVIYFV